MAVWNLFGKNRNKQSDLVSNGEHVKILFRFHSNLFDKEMVETMWALVVNEKKNLYKVDSIPFYAPLIASDDIVYAEFDLNEQMLTYRKTVAYSGNSIIQVAIMDDSIEVNSIRDSFKEMGCVSEKVETHYFSMEIPESADYTLIKKQLDELESLDVIAYAESCLADGHRY